MTFWHLKSLQTSNGDVYSRIRNHDCGSIYVIDTELNINHSELLHARINVLNKPESTVSGHATSTTSLICGKSLGIAPNAEVFFIESGRTYETIYQAISILAEHRVTNWRKPAVVYIGWNFRNNELPEQFSNALSLGLKTIYQNNSMIFSSVGFEDSRDLFYPATEEIVISVGAFDHNNIISKNTNKSFTNIPDLYAPGIDVCCAIKNDEYELKSGASYAAALAAASFLYYLDGSLTAKESLRLYMANLNYKELEFQEDDDNFHDHAHLRSTFLGLRQEKYSHRLEKK